MSLIETIVSLGLSLLVIGGGVTFIANEIFVVKKINQKIEGERELLSKLHKKMASDGCYFQDKVIRCEKNSKVRMLFLP